jgi:DNA-binding CsgD family transcriptional regulator
LTDELRIEHMTENGGRWLNEYFAWRQNTSARLPDKLRHWAVRQRDFQNPEAALGNARPPLVVEGPGGRLVVRFRQDPGRRVTLLLSEHRRLQRDSFAGFGLTPREQEVLLWISEGKSNPEIGRILGISPRTVDKHVERLLAKMKVESRGIAMLKALSRTA